VLDATFEETQFSQPCQLRFRNEWLILGASTSETDTISLTTISREGTFARRWLGFPVKNQRLPVTPSPAAFRVV
jgi:hypothetical protein